MACKLQDKIEEDLITGKVIDSKSVILDLDKLMSYNDAITELAYTKHGIGAAGVKAVDVNHKTVLMANGNPRTINKIEYNEQWMNVINDMDESMHEAPVLIDLLGIKDKVITKDAPSALELENSIESLTTSSKILGTAKKKSYSLQEVLDNIKSAISINSLGENLMDSILTKSKAKVKVVDELLEKDTLMQYNSFTDTIEVNPAIMDKVDEQEAVRALLHEAVHSVTVNLYNGNNMESKMFRQTIDEAFAFYKQSGSKEYGFTSPEEFIAEIMTNPVFVKELDTIQQSIEGSLFSKLINAIRALLGLPAGIMRQRSKSLVEYIVDKSKPIPSNTALGNIFQTKMQEEQVERTTNLTTLEDKFEFALNRINESIQINSSNLKIQKNRTKNKEIKESIQNKLDNLKELDSEIEEYQLTNKAKALTTFIKHMQESLGRIEYYVDRYIDLEDVDKAIFKINNNSDFLRTYAVVDEIQELLSNTAADPVQKLFSKEELKELRGVIEQAKGKYELVSKDLLTLKKQAMSKKLSHIKYFPMVEHKWKNKLSAEYKNFNKPGSKADYITAEMIKRKDQVDADVQVELQKLMDNPIYDVAWQDAKFSSAINAKSPLVQIFNHMLIQANSDRIAIEKAEDVKLVDVYDALVAEKGTTNITKLYENIMEQGLNGEYFLLGEYKAEVFEQMTSKLKELRDEYEPKKLLSFAKLKELSNSKGQGHVEYQVAEKEHNALSEEYAGKIKAVKSKYTILDKDGNIVRIKAAYKNNKSLSPAEKKALDYFKSVAENSNKVTYGQDPLVVSLYGYRKGPKFYKLPKITKTDSERYYTGDFTGALKEKKEYLTKERPDDTDYTTKNLDLAGNTIRQLRVHYRDRSGDFNHKNQSLDLSGIFRLEFKNANKYNIRKHKEAELNFMLDIAKSKQFYKKEGTSLGISLRNKKLNVQADTQSNTFKMMNNMLEARFYDILSDSKAKIGNVDANKLVNVLNGATSFIGMSLNIASGTANIVNSNAQMFLETFIKGNTFTAKNIAKANKLYSKHLPKILKDVNNPIATNFVDQVNEVFNTRGQFNISEADFIKTTLLKNGLSKESLQVFQNSGEHWVQSVLTMSLLDNIKVKNKAHRFIDSKGKVVSEDKAASLLDMMVTDPKTGIVSVSEEVAFTSKSTMTEWNEGGKVQIEMLLRKKIDDTIGNYTQDQQADVYRHYLGKLGMMYRKYLVPMGQARFKGIISSYKSKDELREDQLDFNYAIQEYEEGVYTSLVRFGWPMIKNYKEMLQFKTNWSNLSDYEKHNIKRATTEIVITSVMLPLAISLLEAMKADDDDELTYFLMYQLRRLDTELSAYRDPRETFKMLRSPIPSQRILENAMDVLGNTLTPWNWGEEDSKGKNKYLKSLNKFNPAKKLSNEWSNLYSFQSGNYSPK